MVFAHSRAYPAAFHGGQGPEGLGARGEVAFEPPALPALENDRYVSARLHGRELARWRSVATS